MKFGMEKELKKKNTQEKTQPVHNENYHGYIASSDFYKSKPIEWKYMEGEPTMYCLMTNHYQRMWMDEQKEWYDRRHAPRREPVNVIKKYVAEFKDKVHPSLPKINTRLCQGDKFKNAAENNKIEKKIKRKLKKSSEHKIKHENDRSVEKNDGKGDGTDRSVRSVKSKASESDDKCQHVNDGNKEEIEKAALSNRSKESKILHSGREETSERSKHSARSISKASVTGENVEAREVKEIFKKHELSATESTIDETNTDDLKSIKSRQFTNRSERDTVKESHTTVIAEDGGDTQRSVVSRRNGLNDEDIFCKPNTKY